MTAHKLPNYHRYPVAPKHTPPKEGAICIQTQASAYHRKEQEQEIWVDKWGNELWYGILGLKSFYIADFLQTTIELAGDLFGDEKDRQKKLEYEVKARVLISWLKHDSNPDHKLYMVMQCPTCETYTVAEVVAAHLDHTISFDYRCMKCEEVEGRFDHGAVLNPNEPIITPFPMDYWDLAYWLTRDDHNWGEPFENPCFPLLKNAEGSQRYFGQETRLYDDYATKDYKIDRDRYRGLALGNWNAERSRIYKNDKDQIPIRETERVAPIVGDLLEQLGFEIDWSESYQECEDCYLPVRINHDSYCWQPRFISVDSCGIICECCLEGWSLDEWKQHLEDEVEGKAFNYEGAGKPDLEECGYVQINEEELDTGWHRGQDADADKVKAQLNKHGITRIIFDVSEVSQFYHSWNIWVHETEIDAAKAVWNTVEVYGPSNADRLKEALSGKGRVKVQREDLPEDGTHIIVAHMDLENGTTEVQVTAEEFAAGKALEIAAYYHNLRLKEAAK